MSVTMENYLQAQHAVLGSALIEPQLVPKVIQQTRKEDFTGPARTVYNAMCRLFADGVTVDVVTLANALGSDYRNYLMELMQITPTAANVDYYLSLCREQAKVLALRDIGVQISTAENSEELRILLDEANALMVDKSALRITTMEDAMRTFMERHVGERKYLSWAIPALNKVLYCEPGDFVLLGGYPSAGKSAFALQCCWHWAERMNVGFFSLETSSEKLFDRKMAGETGLTMEQIKLNQISDSDWERIGCMVERVVTRKLELIPASGMTVAQVRSVTAMRRYDLIIIDYVQLLSAEGFNRTEQVTNISLALHRLAQDMKVTVIGLSQLKRKENSDTPENSDLRESGQLEQDADVIMMLRMKAKSKMTGPRQLFITKNKEGARAMIELDFDGQRQTFSKAKNTQEVVDKYTHEGKKVRRKNAQASMEQMSIVTEYDPEMPFGKEEEIGGLRVNREHSFHEVNASCNVLCDICENGNCEECKVFQLANRDTRYYQLPL